MKALSTLRRKLYPYQRDGVRRFFEQGRLLLADDKLVDAKVAPANGTDDDALDAVEPAEPAPQVEAAISGAAALSAAREPAATLLTAFSRLALVPLPNGGLRIDAPAELARPLAELLESLARSLRSSATSTEERPG